MKYIATTILLILGMGSIHISFAQKTASPKNAELKIGDQVPDLEFRNIINYKSTTAKLSDFKGKLVLLDFWATWCVPCVEALPKLDSLQKKFKDELVILPISAESTTTVQKMFDTNESIKDIMLPSVTNGNFQALFNFRALPHEVWIDGAAKVVAITGGEQVNEETIRMLLTGSKNQLSEKRDIIVNDKRIPMLLGGLGDHKFNPEDVQYSSILLPYIKNLPSRSQLAPNKNKFTTVFRFSNVTLRTLYQSAFSGNPDRDIRHWYLNSGARFIWEAKDRSLFYSKTNPAKLPDSLLAFNYELIMPLKDTTLMNRLMLEDLNRYFGSKFGLEGTKEKRKVLVWTLEKKGNLDIVKTKGGTKTMLFDRYKKSIVVTNTTIDEFLTRLVIFELAGFPIPIINETGYMENIDLNLAVDPKNFEEIRQALEPLGLVFKKRKRSIEMVILKDKK